MTKQQFKNKELTSIQQTVINLETYPQYLRACAGTGKTEILIQKIIHILSSQDNLSLSNFAVITFTNKAAEEMKDRLSDGLYRKWLSASDGKTAHIRRQLEITGMADICTIHSFCERLLREYGLSINLSPNFSVKSFAKDTSDIIFSVVNDNFDNALFNNIPHFRIEKLISVLLYNNSNHGIRLTSDITEKLKIPALNNNYWNSFKELYLDMYCKAYETVEKHKTRYNVLTPNDLIRRAIELFSVQYVTECVSGQYRYVFADEMQDTNKDQFDLMEILIRNGVKVFLVGDDKQSIYAFRGADVENSRHMHSLINAFNDSPQDYYLNENYRSSNSVISTINRIFGHKFAFRGQTLDFPFEALKPPETANSDDGVKPLRIMYSKEIDGVILDIVQNSVIDGKKVEFGDIAVLCRRNYDLDIISARLKECGIPSVVAGGRGFYKTKEVTDTYKVINAALNTDMRYMNELIYTDYYSSLVCGEKNVTVVEFMSELVAVLRKETVEEALTFIYEKSGILKYYRRLQKYQAVSNLFKLRDISRTLMDKDNIQPLQFLDYLYIMISTNQEEDEADIPEIERDSGVVTLYSVHKAKGLSFLVVILPYLDNKLNRPVTKPKIILDVKSENSAIAFDFEFVNRELPPDSEYTRLLASHTQEQLEEELRIFYVACTRAEKQLIFSAKSERNRVLSMSGNDGYASVMKWVLQIENGKFEKEFMD